MSAPSEVPWWRGVIPRRRRRAAVPVIRLPDGSAVPTSFAAALLGRRERVAIEARRRGARYAELPPGRLGRAALAAGLRPSVDSIGPRAEALLGAWVEEVDREPPEIVAALETKDRAAFLLRGWVTPASFPRNRRLRRREGTAVSFEVLGRLDDRGRAGAALMAGSVAGDLMPRLRPSPSVAADGLLVPVGFAEEGCLYLPLVASALAVAGERARELLVALCVYAQMRIGADGCRVLATEALLSLLDAVVPVELLGRGPEEAAAAIRGFVIERWTAPLSHREAVPSARGSPPPVALLFLDPKTAEAAKGSLPRLTELGVGVLVWGQADMPRRIWVPGQAAQVVAGPELRPMEFAPALLSPDAMVEAALVLRRPVAPVPEREVHVRGDAPATAAEAASGRPASPQAEAVASATVPEAEDAPVRVLCFGGVRVLLAGEPVEGGWRKKALELLALLVSRPDGLTRDKVLDALWPEDPPDKTGDRLRQCLRQLRQRLGAGGGTAVAEWVDDRLRLDRAVWSDVGAFEAGVEEAQEGELAASERVAALRRAVDLYGGTFCDGHPYDWTLPVQERLRREFLEASAQLAEALVASGEHDEALRALDRAIEEDPFAEHLHRRAVEIEGERGRIAAARARYEKLRRLLADELGTEPSEETERVHASIAKLQ